MEKKNERLMRIDFGSKSLYGDDDDKYIKTKIKIYAGSIILEHFWRNVNMNKKG